MYNTNSGELSQHEKIFVIMLRDFKRNSHILFWRASMFQHEIHELFVGYEASARMSELVKLYPAAFETRQNGRFREIRFKFENAHKIHRILPHELGRHLVKERIIN